ncbi:MAG: inositol monophosphatase family protein [Myxococcota bacterium]
MSYQSALDATISAAREAGRMLREEMSRDGGPRSTDVAKAPIDVEVERFLHEALRKVNEAWGWESEEDPALSRAGSPCWIVDPNDGTLYYLQGYRGATVSIALVDGSEALLGVVYAFNAPDEAGDLFAWGKGCGPATRNGEAMAQLVDRPLLGGEVVLVSPAADKAPRDNATMVAPARFVGASSLAGRLARAAAGDAIAGSAYSNPVRHDYAAGAALLRAVGGDVVDENGASIDLAGKGVRCCFGGVPSAARSLAERGADFQSQVPMAPLASPLADRRTEDSAILSRALGCWFGQLSGDSLGSLVEFQSPASILRKYPDGVRDLADGGTFNTIAGQPTDDSEMALGLARSLVELRRYDAEAAANAYIDWYDSRPFDIGNTVGTAMRAGLSARKQGKPILSAISAVASTQSQANGALMRLAPLAIFGSALDPDHLARHAAEDARVSHPHRACQDANRVFACTLAHAIAHGPSSAAVYRFAVVFAESIRAHDVVRGALADAEGGPPADFMHQMGWLRLALQNAFHQLLHAPSLEEGLVDTVGRGGDTDTNACIAGALLGAVHGRSAVPWRWQAAVLACRPLEGLPDVRRPRPRWLWPCDAEVLAEQLLLAGRDAALR